MRSWVLFAITIVLCVVLFGYIAYGLVSDALQFRVDDNNNNDPLIPNETGETNDAGVVLPPIILPTETTDSGGVTDPDEITEATFLFIGTDYQPEIFDYEKSGYDEDGFYINKRKVEIDALLLLKIDKKKETFMFSSIPVDTIINTVTNKTVAEYYRENGAEFMIECVHALTGIKVEHLAVIGVEDCVKAMKEIGDITYTVPCDMFYEDPAQNYKIELTEGEQKLTPKQAVDMIRYNSYPADSKYTRETVLLDFTQALFSKLTSPAYFGTAVSLFTKSLELFETEFTVDDFTDHLDLIFSYQNYKVKTIKYPGYIRELDDKTVFIPSMKEALTTYGEYK